MRCSAGSKLIRSLLTRSDSRVCVRGVSAVSSQSSSSSKPRSVRAPKRRLDDVCCDRFPDIEPHVLRSWIAQGKVTVANKVVLKAGTPVPVTAGIQLLAVQEKYVCRAGQKLEAALQEFSVDVRGKHVLDCGISTGGFTDCLLQHGAASVIGVDVGYGQVAERVRQDPRLTVLERTNIRYLKLGDLPEGRPVDVVTLDLSFISILTVLTAVKELMKSDAELVTLIKPQFEARREQVEEGGVVRDSAVHAEVIARIKEGAEQLGFVSQGVVESPIKGATSGNKEFLAHFRL